MPKGSNQVAAVRPTEGGPSTGAHLKSTETKRQRGRPKGAKNKAKSLIPADLANSLLLQMRDMLPPDHFEYMRAAIRDGRSISTLHEVQVMLLILGRNLLPAMMEEMKGEVPVRIDPEIAGELGIDIDPDESKPKITFRKDVTERIKAWTALANLAYQMDKKSDEGTDSRQKPIFEIYARRGIDAARLRVLIGGEFGSVGGDPNLDRGPTIIVGAAADKLPERQVNVSDSEQVPASRLLASGINRSDSRSDNEAELQGEYSFDWGEGG